MDATFIKEMKKELVKEQARVTQELSLLSRRTDGDGVSLEDTLKKLLRDIDKALERMREGTYGTCKYCSKEINEARLQARPASSSCIECKKSLTQGV